MKLLDKERRSHIGDFNFDEALGLFAGLNILPKKRSPPTTRIAPARPAAGCSAGSGPGPVLFPEAEAFSLDFHAIPYRGEPDGLENHHLPRRGKAGPSVLTFFALEQNSRCCATPTPT